MGQAGQAHENKEGIMTGDVLVVYLPMVAAEALSDAVAGPADEWPSRLARPPGRVRGGVPGRLGVAGLTIRSPGL
jgi:hypothetical protein